VNLAEIRREFLELPLAVIDEPVLPSRSSMDDEKMAELVDSIRTNGLIQPMSVARVADRYEVIAGHRRRIACGRAGLVAAPCIVYPSKAVALEAVKFAENRHREDLSAADEAIWFNELLEQECGGDIDRLCALLNEKRSYVDGRVLLLSGDEQVFRALEAGTIGIGVAQQLNRCTDMQHRRMLLYQATTGGATVAIVSGWISEWIHVHAPANPQSADQAPAPVSGPVPEMNFFRCALCGKTDQVHAMQPVNMHTYCKAASFDDMLAMWTRRHEFARYPRTLDEAVALVNELVDRFPQLLESEARRI
jgi:ParB/RepB/Spo0J family partition protein